MMSESENGKNKDLMQEPIRKETESKKGMPEMAPPLFVVCFIVCIFCSSIVSYRYGYLKSVQDYELETLRRIEQGEKEEAPDGIEVVWDQPIGEPVKTLPQAEILQNMRELYAMNDDMIGWLTIEDTKVDYPVMQTMQDEEYYLNRDFQKKYSSNGCLIMDTDSVVGSGTAANDYADGTKPGTNLIIHGHNMKNGEMFGDLDRFKDQDYCDAHSIIRFRTLYEEREYEVISVFLSQVYLKSQTDVFKYYKFFQANTQEEFNDWYDNIRTLSLVDTKARARFGDEFISLSVCAYHVENGRLVVVGKRIK